MSKPTARWIEYWTNRLTTLIDGEIAQEKTKNAVHLDSIEANALKSALKEVGVQKEYEQIQDLMEEAQNICEKINNLQKAASKQAGKIDGMNNQQNRYGYRSTRNLDDYRTSWAGYGHTTRGPQSWKDWGAISNAFKISYDRELSKTDWGQRIVKLQEEKLRINDTIMLSASDAELRDKIKSILTHLGIPTTELQDALDG